jgi:hypothetical protein
MTGIFTVLRARVATGADLNASPRVLAFLRAAGSAAANPGGWNRREPEPR